MKNLTFSLNNIVRIHINFGEFQNTNLVLEFYKFLAENNIYNVPGAMKGLKIYIGYFAQEDAIHVEKWLLKHGGETEELSLEPLINHLKNIVVGLKMFLVHVNTKQIERLAMQVLKEIKPEHKELLLEKMDKIYAHSPAAREFAKALLVKIFDASKKGQLFSKIQLSSEQVLQMEVRDIFSPRTFNCLGQARIHKISELIDLIKRDKFILLKLRNFGQGATNEVNAFLKLYNMSVE